MYRDHFPSLLGYALRRTAQPEQAGDVTAETMLIAWRRIGEVPVGDDERLWLFGVARRVLANQRRGEARRLALLDKLNQHVRTAVETAADGAVVVQMDLRQAMLTLDDGEREVIELTSWEGLSPGEAAVVLGIPAVTARTRLHRARTKLRASMDGDRQERSDVAGHVDVESRSALDKIEETTK
jgi:RNA polymerase sigma-70 factor (ECF subfamily)